MADVDGSWDCTVKSPLGDQKMTITINSAGSTFTGTASGAMGTAEACFETSYGYDVRTEVLGSGGMVEMGSGRRTGMVFSGPAGRLVETARSDQELFAGAYTAELAAFVEAVREGRPAPVTGEDARAALAIALAAAESVRTGGPVRVDK